MHFGFKFHCPSEVRPDFEQVPCFVIFLCFLCHTILDKIRQGYDEINGSWGERMTQSFDNPCLGPQHFERY